MKQWINRSLAALLALSLLAGCSQTAPGDASSVPQQETSASEAEPTIPEPPQPEPQQQAAPPAPRAAAPAQPAQQPESTQPARQYTEDEMRIIEGDDDDLPF